ADQRALAGPVRPEDADNLAAAHVERDALRRIRVLAALFPELLFNVVELQRVRRSLDMCDGQAHFPLALPGPGTSRMPDTVGMLKVQANFRSDRVVRRRTLMGVLLRSSPFAGTKNPSDDLVEGRRMLVGCARWSVRHSREQGALLPRETRDGEAEDVHRTAHEPLSWMKSRWLTRIRAEPTAY